MMQTDVSHFEVVVAAKARALWRIDRDDRSAFELIHYFRLRICGICFFAMEGMGADDVIFALVDRYPKPAPKARH